MIRAARMVALAGLLAAAWGAATSMGWSAEAPAPPDPEIPAYDGRYTFVRLRYGGVEGGFSGGRGGRRRGDAMWNHDWPRAETNFLRIVQELTSVETVPERHVILDLADPEIFRHPIAYIVEVGFWQPSDEEVAALRTWLLKGGFLIVDDFRGDHLDNFVAQMRRVLPDAKLKPLEAGEPIWDSFFHIADPYSLMPPYDQQLAPVYLGIFEGDDPAGRLMVIANYNQDHAEYWEFSDYGYYPIDLSNEAYKFGVNYLMYGLTH